MDEKQKGIGMAIVACIIAAALAVGVIGVYFLTEEGFGTPTPVSPLNDSETADNTPTFEWESVPNAENYRLLVDNDSDFSSPEVDITLGAGENSYTVPDENTFSYGSYYWKVIAIKGDVERESDTWTFEVTIEEPTLVSPLNDSETTDNTPTFEWESVPNAENYRLLVDNDLEFSTPEVDITLGDGENSYTVPDENTLPYGSYYWKVIAIRGSVERESDTWTFEISEV